MLLSSAWTSLLSLRNHSSTLVSLWSCWILVTEMLLYQHAFFSVLLELWCSSLSLTNHPGQLSLAIPPWVGAMSTGQRAVMLCDWGVKADMVSFAGNTVWSISERVRGVCVDALYKSMFTYLLTYSAFNIFDMLLLWLYIAVLQIVIQISKFYDTAMHDWSTVGVFVQWHVWLCRRTVQVYILPVLASGTTLLMVCVLLFAYFKCLTREPTQAPVCMRYNSN